ncbi:hypothetical protein MASR2M18_14920 [Ignavibacteria bacterium]|nr:3-hydroxybutyryl-CoA dehydrogenase [Bacteroidota bacterium]MCZ2132951.1 3-hydroxybutyryl-CoA dehydrogenase [Bacteroidota bacterium]
MTLLIISTNNESLQFEKAMQAAGINCLQAFNADNWRESDDEGLITVDFMHDSATKKAERLMAYTSKSAIVLCSTLCCTATDVMGRLENKLPVIGINGLTNTWIEGKTVEIAPAMQCPPEAIAKVGYMLGTAGFSVEYVEDRTALVSARILATLINEAAFSVLENVAAPGDIDTAMKLGVNYPKGLLAWADEIGIDNIVRILDALYEEYHQERYRACVLLRQFVRAGRLGRSVGRGFYTYEN